MKRNFYLFVISLIFVSGAFQMKEVYAAEICVGSRCTLEVNVSARNPLPTSSELRRSSPETRITITSRGQANRGGGNRLESPYGEIGKKYKNAISPENYIGALLVKTGYYYTPIEGGLVNWKPPTDNIIEFIYNDTHGGFNNNTGGFTVIIEYNIGDLR
jgi:hypothetical protein